MIFISYASAQKDAAGVLKAKLDEQRLMCFLAHEDIEEGEEWRDRIWKALHECTAFIGLISADFNSSSWCQQETGIALALKKPCMWIKMTNTDPAAFAGAYQAVKAKFASIITALKTKSKFRSTRVFSFIQGVARVTSYKDANAVYDAFWSEWSEMTDREKVEWLEKAIDNGQVTTEGFKIGPFFSRAAKELGPTLPKKWFEEHDPQRHVPRT